MLLALPVYPKLASVHARIDQVCLLFEQILFVDGCSRAKLPYETGGAFQSGVMVFRVAAGAHIAIRTFFIPTLMHIEPDKPAELTAQAYVFVVEHLFLRAFQLNGAAFLRLYHF